VGLLVLNVGTTSYKKPIVLTIYGLTTPPISSMLILILWVDLLRLTKIRQERSRAMKIVALCKEGTCCPVVKITDSQVEIGEKDNTCVLTMTEWEILKEKILTKEL
jgi:hypothetical protein